MWEIFEIFNQQWIFALLVNLQFHHPPRCKCVTVHRLFGQLQLAACLGGVLKFHRFMGSAIYLWNMSISLSNWRMACVVWVRVLTKSGDGERVPRGLKIPIRWAKIPAVGKRTTTAPLLHKSTGSTFDASTLLLLIHIASAFPMACVHPLPPWTLAVVALVQSLCTLHGCRWPEFTWFTHQPQIYALPRRLAPPIEQLCKFQIERWQLFGTTLLDLTAMGEGV